MKPMINIGQKATSKEKQLELLLERGYDLYVLRLRKGTEYSVTIHGLDDITVRPYRAPNSNEVSYHLQMRPASYAAFHPNEEGVALAYVPGTARNIDIIASHHYSNQFELIEIITPSGRIPKLQAQAKMRVRADKLGIKPAANDSAYNRHLQRLNRPVDRNRLSMVPVSLSGDETVAKVPVRNDDDVNEMVAPQRPIIESVAPMTEAEAIKMAEDQVHTKYASLIEFIKKRTPKAWKNSPEYKAVVRPEIELVQENLIKQVVGSPAGEDDVPPPPPVFGEGSDNDSLVE